MTASHADTGQRWPMTLSTKVIVRFDFRRPQTRLEVRIESQSFVTGDVFNFYGRLLNRIAHEIEASYASGDAAGA